MNSPIKKHNLSIHNWPAFIISSSGSLHWSAFIRLWQIPKWSSLQNRIKEILKVYSQRARMFFEIRKLLWQKIMGKFNLCTVIASICKFLNRHCRKHMVTNTQKPPDSNSNLAWESKVLGLCFIICHLKNENFVHTLFIIINFWSGPAMSLSGI